MNTPGVEVGAPLFEWRVARPDPVGYKVRATGNSLAEVGRAIREWIGGDPIKKVGIATIDEATSTVAELRNGQVAKTHSLTKALDADKVQRATTREQTLAA